MRKILSIPTLGATLLLQGGLACAESDVDAFRSTVTIQGEIGQRSSGNSNRQDVNVGSASHSRTRSFNANVSTGDIRQTAQGSGIQQRINAGSMQNSQASTFSANVHTRSIEQVATQSGQRQEVDIGSVTNSTVKGNASTSVTVGQGIKQVGSGEIVLGSVKNSTVGNFNQNLTIQGRLSGNNIRMGSVVGQQRYGDDGSHIGTEAAGSSADEPFESAVPKATSKTKNNGPFTSLPPSASNADSLLTGVVATLQSDPQNTGMPSSSLENLSDFVSGKKQSLYTSAASFSIYNAFLEMSSSDVVMKHFSSLTKSPDATNKFKRLITQAIKKTMQDPSVIKSLKDAATGFPIDLITLKFSDILKQTIGIDKGNQNSLGKEMLHAFGDYGIDIATAIVKNLLVSQYQAKGNQALAYLLFSTGVLIDTGGIVLDKSVGLGSTLVELGTAKEHMNASWMNNAETYYNILNRANSLKDQMDLIVEKKNTFDGEAAALLGRDIDILQAKEGKARDAGLNGLNDLYASIAKERDMDVRDVSRVMDAAIRLKALHENGAPMKLSSRNEKGVITATEANSWLDFALQDYTDQPKKKKLMLDMIETYLPDPPTDLLQRLNPQPFLISR